MVVIQASEISRRQPIAPRLSGRPDMRQAGYLSSIISLACAVMALVPVSIAEAQTRSVWQALKTGQAVALLRHAKAPAQRGQRRVRGPILVNLMDCSSQRNLSQAGRAQAARIGRYLRSRGVTSARVVSSAYCRTADTARLLGFGGVSFDYDLNALSRPTAGAQTAGLRRLIRSAPPGLATILVTHKTNIRAATGVSPADGEAIVVNRRGRVIGRIRSR
jgi:phosphohistidine phosphatase SixA